MVGIKIHEENENEKSDIVNLDGIGLCMCNGLWDT